ncbi:MAG: type II secretion system F family protein [Pseudomonadota bacterium]
MAEFAYTVIDATGRERKGVIEAGSLHVARATLNNDGDLVLDIRPARKRQWLKLEKKSQVSYKQAAAFAMELAGLLNAGAPIRKALAIQSDGTGVTADLAATCIRALDRGDALSSALAGHGGAAQLLAEFVRAGESGAGLNDLLLRGGQFLETRAIILSRLTKALTYPAFILLITVIALIVLFLFVAPSLAPIFRDAQQSSVIVWMADIGEWVIVNQSLVFSVCAVLLGLAFLFVRTPPFKRSVDATLWRLPFFGSIVQDLDTGQSCDVLSALLERGRPLEVSLKHAASVAGPTLSTAYLRISQRLRDGVVASSAFGAEKHLPQDVRRLIVLGEKSSAFAPAIRQAGELCRERAIVKLDRLTSVLGPALVIGLGVLVSLLMLTVLQSLTSLTDSVI